MDSKIYLGDYREVLPKIKNNSIQLIVIDPPYLTTKQAWDKTEEVTPHLVAQLCRILKSTGSLYVWCGIGEKSQSLIRWFPTFNKWFCFKDLITWKKKRGMGMRKGWLYTREEIMWFVKDNKQFTWNKKHQYSNEKQTNKFAFPIYKKGYVHSAKFKRLTNVWVDIPEAMKGGRTHFTPKPIEALKRIIAVHTQKGDTVLDCFAGSGSTGIACQQLDRKYLLIEKDVEFYRLIKERLK